MKKSVAEYAELLKHILDSHQDIMLEQLHTFCNINSGSQNLDGLSRMLDALKQAFMPLVDEAETIQLPPILDISLSGDETHRAVGPILYLRKRPHLSRRVLLSGHMDTVFNQTHPFQTITELKPGILNGPGVTDMKGGLIAMLHALDAFEQTDISKSMGWDVVINADEELGSPASAAFLKKIRANYQAALVYEPAVNIDGEFARNRKGSGKFTLVAGGKTAHAGRAFKAGRNAIIYLAKALLEVNQLNQNTRNITFNIGEIAGGKALNIVPDVAVAKLDIRTCHPDDEAWVMLQFQRMIKQLEHEDYTLTLHGAFGRPVKQVNAASKTLFKRLQALAESQGATLNWQDTGGCSDGNNLAEAGLAVIDTLGVRGGNIHSPEEFLVVDSLIERAHLTALLLTDLAEGGLEALLNAA
ncbi:MAG: hydrolase [Gammaproteobacteria bacterium]|nr:hydrolase [Gammaproteobacteria bacterium]